MPSHPFFAHARTRRRVETRPARRGRRAGRTVGPTVALALAVGLSLGLSLGFPLGSAGPALATGNPATPGAFTGYGFDQCLTPTQPKMDAWLSASPYRAVGIYISGASRGCRSQPNLTPTWVSTQLAQGWHLLPITLGPQASCNPLFPRYGNDPVISAVADANGLYSQAAAQGVAEAGTTVAAAQALGISPGSTMYYDLEGFDATRTSCRESALSFLSAWTQQIHALGYVSGVYSSAGSGIKVLDDARVLRPGVYTMPDQIWIARWDGEANTTTSYIRSDGWLGGRIKQYQGGHDETYGGVTINIDRDYLDLSGTVTINSAPAPVIAASPPPDTHCHGVPVDFADYAKVKRPVTGRAAPDGSMVSALKCLLKERGDYAGRVKGTWTSHLTTAVHTWQQRRHLHQNGRFTRGAWMTLLSAGPTRPVHPGSTGEKVRRLQRTLNASSPSYGLSISGTYDPATVLVVRAWQKAVGRPVTGVVSRADWTALQAGKR